MGLIDLTLGHKDRTGILGPRLFLRLSELTRTEIQLDLVGDLTRTHLGVLGQNLRLGTGVGRTRTENWHFRFDT